MALIANRLVNVYMNQYFCPAAIDEPNFQLSELKEYYIPPDGDLQSYKARKAFHTDFFACRFGFDVLCPTRSANHPIYIYLQLLL